VKKHGLVLTRKPTEVVVLQLPDGRTLEVGVKEIRRNQVRLQFNGPRDVKIFREEIAEEGLADG